MSHSPANVIFDLHLKVRLDFLIEFVITLSFAEDSE
jgi:hypothetical protein